MCVAFDNGMFTGDSLERSATDDGVKNVAESGSCCNYSGDACQTSAKFAADGAVGDGLLLQGGSAGDSINLSTTADRGPTGNDKSHLPQTNLRGAKRHAYRVVRKGEVDVRCDKLATVVDRTKLT